MYGKSNIVCKTELMHLANLFHFRITHFALGTFPLSSKGALIGLPVNRTFFVLENPDGPENYVESSDSRFEFKPGSLYFIPAYYPVRMVMNSSLKFLSVQSNLSLYAGIDIFSECRQVIERKHPAELPILLRLFHEMKSEDHLRSCLEFRTVMENLLYTLTGEFPESSFHKVFYLHKYSTLMKWLEQNISAETRVSDLASYLSETRETFTRHFHTETGYTPKQILDDFLLGKIIPLLENGISGKEIAGQLNFSDEYLFSKFFKRQTGVSPSLWKKRNF